MNLSPLRVPSALLALAIAGLVSPASAQSKSSFQNLVQYVNPLQGTDSTGGFSTGNTLPLVARPFAMTDWAIQSSEGNWGWWFSPNSRVIQGIRATHQPSPWMGDYGYFTVMAQTGKTYWKPNQRTSTFRHDESVISPHYLKVPLRRYGTLLEMTPTERCSMFRFTFPKDEVGRVLVQMESASQVKIDKEAGTISGFAKTRNDGTPENFAIYFTAKFSRPWKNVRLALDDKEDNANPQIDGNKAGSAVEFDPGAPVVMQLATSFISTQQAQQNLNHEVGSKSFDDIRAEGQEAWNQQLNRITITGATPEQQRTFYSCLYRANLFPRMFHETDASGKVVHYSAYDGKVHDGVSYTDNGFWDTYRTIWPLFSLIQPDRYGEMVDGLLAGYREGGWMAQWPSPGYRVSMPGSHGDAVIADAVVKGLKGFDVNEAYAAMTKHADNPSSQRGAGRNGVASYLKYGYIPGSVSETLDFAYDDFCVSQVAEALGHKEDAARYRQRALNYRNIFDPSVGFMRAKEENGTWRANFNQYEWGGPYVEGGPWQSTWAVQQDPAGMIELFGGRQKFVNKLDELMSAPPRYDIGGYGSEIHEISEMAVLKGFGQYGHGNQPVHHILSLFSAAGEPWKTQYWTRKAMNELYSPDGFAGDEDNGEMGAWYVLNAMGIYPLTPGRPEYVLTSPLFKTLTLNIPGHKPLTIEAPKNSAKNFYVQKVTVNGKPNDALTIPHQALANGGNGSLRYGGKATR